MTDGRPPDDTSGWGERRLRRLAERLAEERADSPTIEPARAPEPAAPDLPPEPAEPPEPVLPAEPVRRPMTRRELRETERRAAEDAERRAAEDAERRAAEDAERRAAEDAERRAAEDAERRAAEDAERRAAEDAERRAAEDAERRAAETPPAAPTDTGPRVRRPVVKPPSAVRRADGPATGQVPAVRAAPKPETPSRRSRTRPPQPPSGGSGPSTAASEAGPNVVPASSPRRRRRWWVVVGVIALLAVAAAAGLRLWGAQDLQDPDDTGEPAAQQTLVLALADAERHVVGAALLGTDGTQSAALLVPTRLLVDVAGGGRVTVADTLVTGDAAPGQALDDALDVRVDGTWVLTTQGLADLVDALGGISVDVTTSVSSDTVAVPAGQGQRLDGAQAVTYATHLAAGETEPARSARLSQVLAGVLAVLPQDAGELEAQLVALAEASRSTQPTGDLADLLADLAATARSGDLGAVVLPVREISTGGDESLFGLDGAEAAAVIDSRFAGSLRPGGQDAVRVLVQNGVGTPGLGEQARHRLVDAGLRYVGGGNAPSLGREKTVVAIPSDSRQDRDRAEAVARALGLPDDVIAVGRDAPTLADVVVVLGADFAAEVESTP